MKDLKDLLNNLYKECDFKKRLKYDPISFPQRYKRMEDIEVSGFISSAFAYGKVKCFMPVIEKLLSIMGSSPYEFLVNFDLRAEHLFEGIRYRFQKEDDIIALLYIIQVILNEYGSIYNLFKRFYKIRINPSRCLICVEAIQHLLNIS